MSTLTDTANGVTMARKDRDNALKALRDEYDAAHNEVYTASIEAEQAYADFERAFRLARKTIEAAFNEKVAELTGTDPSEDCGW